MSDQHHAGVMGCAGDAAARTPHIDRLAKQGIRFSNAYCTFPLCGPSRASFMTGLYPDQTLVHRNAIYIREHIPSVQTMSQRFETAFAKIAEHESVAYAKTLGGIAMCAFNEQSGGAARAKVTLSAGAKSFDLELVAGPAPAFRKVIFADGASGGPVDNVTITSADSVVADGARAGVYFLPAMGIDLLGVSAPGYKRLREATADGWRPQADADTVWLDPWYGGALHGLRFVIDPEGGFGPGPGMGPLGLSGAFVNLQVALHLQEYLVGAGARVLLTRASEETLSPRDVVAVTNRFGANRYIEIRHRNAPEDSGLVVSASHFPGSGTGTAMAEAVQAATASYLGLAVRPPVDEVTFPLQQTACPAIVVSLPSIGDMDEELRLGEPWYQRKQAYGIYVGILRHYGVLDSASLHVTVAADSLVGNWFVTLDDTWSLLTTPAGDARFEAVPPGRYAVELRRGRERAIEFVDVPAAATGPTTLRIAPPRP